MQEGCMQHRVDGRPHGGEGACKMVHARGVHATGADGLLMAERLASGERIQPSSISEKPRALDEQLLTWSLTCSLDMERRALDEQLLTWRLAGGFASICIARPVRDAREA